jgi:nucleoside-diphosphate-sugar epimerase
MDYIIHLATRWGGEKTFRINVDKTLALFSHLDTRKCRKVLYFSTASVLDSDNRPDPQVQRYGTDYMKSKYHCLEQISGLDIQDRVITLFPTVILGGDSTHPSSHASSELRKVWKYLPKLKYFTFEGSFHFIHAHDVAVMTRHVLENSTPPQMVVLGNDMITLDECIKRLCEIAGMKRGFRLNITRAAELLLPLLLKKRLSSWDLYSLKKKHFNYTVSNPKTMGLESSYTTLRSCISR